jgi:DNA-binding CsgD family transcriptional regulator
VTVDLTPAESRVAELIGRGLSCARVAETLGLTQSTVQAYIVSIARKIPNPDRLMARSLVMVTFARGK